MIGETGKFGMSFGCGFDVPLMSMPKSQDWAGFGAEHAILFEADVDGYLAKYRHPRFLNVSGTTRSFPIRMLWSRSNERHLDSRARSHTPAPLSTRQSSETEIPRLLELDRLLVARRPSARSDSRTLLRYEPARCSGRNGETRSTRQCPRR